MSGFGTSILASELDLDRRAELLQLEPVREVRRGRREDVSPVERRRDGLERVLAVRDLVRGLDPAELLRSRDEQPVVGPDVETAVAAPEGDRPALASHARIDDREMDAFGEVRERVREHDRPLQHPVRLDPVRDVDDLDLRRDPLHHAVAGAHEVVLEPEVGQERDQHVRPKLIDPPAPDEAVEVVRLGLARRLAVLLLEPPRSSAARS